MMIYPRLATAVAITAALTAGALGAALAAIPDAGTGVLHGCYSKKTGALRVIDPAKKQKCASGEGAVSWGLIGIAWTGTWSSAIKYGVNEVAVYNGSTYLSTAPNTQKPPPADPAAWSVLSQSGARGTASTTTGPPGGKLDARATRAGSRTAGGHQWQQLRIRHAAADGL